MEISKGKINSYRALDKRKNRLEQGLFVAEGEKCVLETLPFFSLQALVATSSWLEKRLLPLTVAEDKIFTATTRQLSQISSLSTPPAVLAVYRLPDNTLPSPSEIKNELVLALDGIQDPGNLGTIMRAADWFGIRHIIASPATADIFNPKSVQATMGAIGRVKISYTPLAEYIADYRKSTGNYVYGTLLEGKNIYAAELAAKGMIVMGNEGKGITPEVRELISSALLIPPYPADSQTVESLNVAMATAIVLAEFRRQISL